MKLLVVLCILGTLSSDQQFLQDTVDSVGWGDYEYSIIYELIEVESGWNPKAYNAEVVKVYGLGQLTKWWIASPALESYRLTSNWRDRDLMDGHDNILTIVELLLYYHDLYDGDWHRILSAYSSGRDLGVTKYSRHVMSNLTYVRIRHHSKADRFNLLI